MLSHSSDCPCFCAVRFRDKAREKQRLAVLKQRAKERQSAAEEQQSQRRQRQAAQVRTR